MGYISVLTIAPIEVRQSPDEPTRTPGKSCVYAAECTIAGQTYIARSRYGAPNELARVLVAAGVPDAPMQVECAGLCGCITYRSFHKLAGYSLEENAQVSLRRRRYRAAEDAQQGVGASDLCGVIAPAATTVAAPRS